MKQLIQLMLLSLIAVSVNAQSSPKSISGIVKDARNETVPGATVQLIKAADSSIIMSRTTGENGKFSFMNLSNGSYLLGITAVGQKPYSGMSVLIDELHSAITLPPIIMLPSKSRVLDEVIVKAKRPLIEQEVDKTVVNVGSMISSATSNTLEVLEKTPGVMVGPNGEISLNGRAGVLVLIEGRSTYMSGADLAAYLKSIPGGLLEKIELMDNPPARYDAAGNAIINIKLKKNRSAGTTGSISAGYTQGRYARNNTAVNLNYNRKKLNVFANLGQSNERTYNDNRFDRRLYDDHNQQISSINLNNYQQSTSGGINGNAGIDYLASANTTYGLQVNLNQASGHGLLDYTSKSYNLNKALDTVGTGSTNSKDRRTNLGTNFNYLHKFGKTGKELSADLNYLRYNVTADQALQNYLYRPDLTMTADEQFLYLLPADFNIYTIKADYVHPLKNKSKFEAGFKSSIVDNNSIAGYYNVVGDAKQIDNRKSNEFRYHENINAVYINTQKSWKRLAAQLGLRVENTRSVGKQLGNDSVQSSRFKKDYTELFPSVFVNYKLDSLGKNTLTFSITRRINRPNYQYLNPFLFFRDRYSYSAGNPYLNPQYQYRYELRYTHKQWLRMGLSYNRFTNVIFQTTENVNGVFITRPENISKGYMVLLNTGLSLSPAKWWNLNSDILLSNLGLDGRAYTERLNPSTYVVRINLINQFKISKTWSGELGGYYASTDLNGQAFTGAMWRSNFGIQKKIWKDKGSLRLAVEDVFHSWIYYNNSVGLKQAKFYQVGESDTQRFGLAFTYRFGSEDFARKRKHNDNASDEEKGRVQ